MKQESFLDFRDKIHNSRDLFVLPELDDYEFNKMLEKAKIESSSKKNDILLLNNNFTLIKNFIISPRLAAALVIAILIFTFASYININNVYKQTEENMNVQYVDKNTRIPMDNIVRVSSFGGI